MLARNRRGYTLIELVVTVMIIGVLTAVAVPQYLKTVETNKADDAVATVNMIATTNKMFALDHGMNYTRGPFPTQPGASCYSDNGTNHCAAGQSADCTSPGAPFLPGNDACLLVCCNYLADQDWGDKPYTFNACNPISVGSGNCVAGLTAVSARATSGTYGTTIAPYSMWYYTVELTGIIQGLCSGTCTALPPPPTY